MAAPIEFTQGEDVEISLTLTDSEAAPIDITGDTFDAKIKDISDLTTDIATFTCVIADGAGGVVTLTLASALSLAVPDTAQYNAKGVKSSTPSKVLFYDVYRTKLADSTKRRVANGLVTVNPTITLLET